MQGRDTYGTQSAETWPAGATVNAERQIIDTMACQYLWRVSVAGENVLLKLVFGTRKTLNLDNIVLPFVAFVPGQLSIYARPSNPELPAFAFPTLTIATGGAQVVRSIHTALSALDARVSSVVALGAGTTVTVAGAAIALAQGQELRIVAPSALAAGGPLLLEWTL